MNDIYLLIVMALMLLAGIRLMMNGLKRKEKFLTVLGAVFTGACIGGAIMLLVL